MSDADCTPGREPRSVAASLLHIFLSTHVAFCEREFFNELAATLRWFTAGGAIHIAHYDVIDDVITWKL